MLKLVIAFVIGAWTGVLVAALFSAAHDSREDIDPRVVLLKKYLDYKLPPGWYEASTETRRRWFREGRPGTQQRQTVTSYEILTEAFGFAPGITPDIMSLYWLKGVMPRFLEWEWMGSQMIEPEIPKPEIGSVAVRSRYWRYRGRIS